MVTGSRMDKEEMKTTNLWQRKKRKEGERETEREKRGDEGESKNSAHCPKFSGAPEYKLV